MKTSLMIAVATMVGLSGCAAPPEALPGNEDAAFLQDAARQDLLEVRLGELAQRYAQLPDVAAYGRRMAEEHGQALEALRRIAQTRRAALPLSPDTGQMEDYYQLATVGGDAFHRQYMDRELWAKRSELDVLRREMSGGADAQLLAFARDHQSIVADEQQLGIDVEVRNRLNVPIPPAPGGNTR